MEKEENKVQGFECRQEQEVLTVRQNSLTHCVNSNGNFKHDLHCTCTCIDKKICGQYYGNFKQELSAKHHHWDESVSPF